MPELPDITVYVDHLARLLTGKPIDRIRLFNPFLVRTYDPPIEATTGKTVIGVRRMGKQIVFELEDGLYLILHLMIAGRLHWRGRGAKPPGKIGLIALDFPNGTLLLTEAGTKRRASLHLVRGDALASFDRGGLEVLDATLDEFRAALCRESHTLKRALTDPRLFSGIGNSYSDEILHRARLSPMQLSTKLSDDEFARLYDAIRDVMTLWVRRLIDEAGEDFPEGVTAFRPDMAVHGRYRKPCPVCGAEVQRIVYAENEANYCPACQTGGKLLADRALSRLLKSDWPRTLDELEQRRAARG